MSDFKGDMLGTPGVLHDVNCGFNVNDTIGFTSGPSPDSSWYKFLVSRRAYLGRCASATRNKQFQMGPGKNPMKSDESGCYGRITQPYDGHSELRHEGTTFQGGHMDKIIF